MKLTSHDEEVLERVPAASDVRYAYLKPTVKIEPLVDRWPAWTHVLAPAQQAMNLVFRYLPAIQSFISAPAVHLAAARDPEMYGGPFVDLPLSAVPAAEKYVADVMEKRAEAISFAQQFRDSDGRLLSTGSGYSLNEFRLGLPAVLKGRVELVYNLNKLPKMKVIEEMFLDDDMGLRSAQSIFLHETPDENRPFFLSTPRLDDAAGLHINAPFDSAPVKRLCEARTQAVDLVQLAAELDLPIEELSPFFTTEPGVRTGQRFTGEGMRVRYFGHASLLIETSDTTILVDPTFAAEPCLDQPHLCFHDLPETIDLLAISHGHQDHMTIEVLMQLRHRVKQVVVPRNNSGDLADPSLKHVLEKLGFASVLEARPLDVVEAGDAKVTMLPFSGEHCDLDVQAKQCLMVEAKGHAVGLFVDSDAIDIDVYSRLADHFPKLDVLFVGMECNGAPLSWLYGPLTTSGVTKREDNSRRLSGANCGQAWALVELLQPREAYVYAMGQENWMRSLMGLNYKADSIQLIESGQFVDKCIASGIPAERLYGFKELVLGAGAVE